MTFRLYTAEDEPQLRAIHAARGYSFEFPDLNGPDMVSIWVCEEQGRIVSAVVARKTVEISAFVAQDWNSPAWRLLVLQELQARGAGDLRQQGFTDMHSFVTRDIRGFGRRLLKSLGWLKSAGGECLVRGV